MHLITSTTNFNIQLSWGKTFSYHRLGICVKHPNKTRWQNLLCQSRTIAIGTFDSIACISFDVCAYLIAPRSTFVPKCCCCLAAYIFGANAFLLGSNEIQTDAFISLVKYKISLFHVKVALNYWIAVAAVWLDIISVQTHFCKVLTIYKRLTK